jgi:hypothetical protein
MNGPRRSAAASCAQGQRSAQARAILRRHFGYSQCALENYFNQAAQREGLKVAQIENAVIRLASELN